MAHSDPLETPMYLSSSGVQRQSKSLATGHPAHTLIDAIDTLGHFEESEVDDLFLMNLDLCLGTVKTLSFGPQRQSNPRSAFY